MGLAALQHTSFHQGLEQSGGLQSQLVQLLLTFLTEHLENTHLSRKRRSLLSGSCEYGSLRRERLL